MDALFKAQLLVVAGWAFLGAADATGGDRFAAAAVASFFFGAWQFFLWLKGSRR